MVHTLEEFLHYWAYETEATIKQFECLTDEKLMFSCQGFTRNIGFLANHIIETVQEMPTTAGLENIITFENKNTVQDLITHYKDINASFIAQLSTQWTNEILLDEIPMYGETWKKKEVLLYLMQHQTHHRGQLSVLIKAAGLKNTGIYGPTAEDWAAMGMEILP
jgi:uncharacterized damage-inducible protein DinB